ncbi:HNH endonuclease signature motif containing protein [Lactiplantibacillus plantarum]|uniref:HNH endonuclease signature motif containing protein n=1 Tax=Lactiplantibacillus plantarum TaxID=1590 RepID=UPI00223FB8A2|nr:HNH endonuclease signature motif containing protein [Lactiplantibacillus plantarum]
MIKINKRYYTQNTIKTLMLLSGGRCELCQKQIIFPYKSTSKNDPAYNNICEIAHIFGLNPGSARYDVNKGAETLNEPNNLMILCPNCHKQIDKLDGKYKAADLIAKKTNFENETIQSIVNMVNKTNIGGHITYKNGMKLLKYFSKENNYIPSLNNLDDLDTVINVDVSFECLSKRLILTLNDLNIDSRTALLIISKLDPNQDEYRTTYAYWDSAYGNNIKQVLEPLSINHYIDLDTWKYGDCESDDKLEVVPEWAYIISFLSQNKIPLEKLIIQRDYTIFDE